MPIARPPGGGGAGGGGVGGGTGTLITSSTTIPETQTVIDPETGEEIEIPVVFGAGKAVCLVLNAEDEEEFQLCSSHVETGNPSMFLGFQINDISGGGRPIVMTMRGTQISDPQVTDGEDLVPGEDIYLSHVAGEVTHNPSEDEGYVELRVGFAVATDKMVLSNDVRIKM